MSDTNNIKRMKLGDILLKYGLITQEQLETALEAQKEFKTRVGRTLVQLGYVSEDDINWALSNQLDVPYVHLNINMIDLNVARSVSREVLELYQMIPIARIDNELTLVMADPTDAQAIESIKAITKLNVSVSLSSSSNILSIIRQVFKDDTQDELQHRDIDAIKTVDYKNEVRKILSKELDSTIFIYTTIFRALELKASEIHLEPGRDLLKVRYKIEEVLYEYSSKPMDVYPAVGEQLKTMMFSASTGGGPGAFTLKVMGQDIRLKAHSAPTIYGNAFVLKVIPFVKEPIKLIDVGLDSEICFELSKTMKKQSGVMIFSSPGKIGLSRTLYAVLREVIFSDKKVVTLEDFVTFRREGFIQMEYSSLNGADDYGALELALGQNPDVLMMSLDLDFQPETLEKIFNLALTGKLILLALPFQNVYTCFCYLKSLGLPSFVLAGALQSIFVQRYFRKLCIHCKSTVTVADYPFMAEKLSHNVCYEKGKGCSECNFSGYEGYQLLYEYYVPSREDRVKILNSDFADDEIYIPSNYKTIRERCYEKVIDGTLSVSEIINI